MRACALRASAQQRRGATPQPTPRPARGTMPTAKVEGRTTPPEARPESPAPSWRNLDGTVLTLMAFNILVSLTTIDREKERPILIFNFFLLLCIALCRYFLAWWDSELHLADGWRRHLTMANGSIVFWSFHLVHAVLQGEKLAPMANRRLTESPNLIPCTLALGGFIIGAEPAAGRPKLIACIVLIVLLVARICLLASWLPTREAATDFLTRAMKTLVLLPAAAVGLGWVTRQRLSSTAAELQWLRSHAEQLETLRQESLRREASRSASRMDDPSSHGQAEGTDRLDPRRHPSPQHSVDSSPQQGMRRRPAPSGAASSNASTAAGELLELLGSREGSESGRGSSSRPHLASLANIGERTPTPEAVTAIRTAREQALWRTLHEMGINPAGSDAGDGSGSTQCDRSIGEYEGEQQAVAE